MAGSPPAICWDDPHIAVSADRQASIVIYCGDCLEVLPTIADASVDAIITDPPYFSTNLHFDQESRLDFKSILDQFIRILTDGGVFVTFADINLICEMKKADVFPCFYDMVWQKNQPQGFLSVKHRPLRNHEYIGVFTKRLKSTYNPQKFNFQSSRFKVGQSLKTSNTKAQANHYGAPLPRVDYVEDASRYPLTVIYAQNWNGGRALERKAVRAQGLAPHPTEKPLDLVSYLVLTYSNPGDTVLDPFMGSGTTGVACAKLGREFVGIEKDEGYFAMAQARIADATEQCMLF